MNSKKGGKLFIILIISLVAYGLGSCANVLNSGNDITFGILPSTFASNAEQQISVINDSSFEPIHVMRHFHINTTNTTNTTNITNTTNSAPIITNKTGNSTTNKKHISGNET